MKKTSLLAAAILLLSACGNAANDAPIAENSAPELKPIASLPLPAFPNYPEPQSTLNDGQSGVIYFPTKSPYDFSRLLKNYEASEDVTGKGTLYLPEGASADNPVPAIVILHGSGGIKAGREMEYGKLFAANGVAGFVVDYYEPRGVSDDTPYTMKTMITTEVDIIADAYAALKILGTHPQIDAARIGVTGYSYGGMATRYTLDDRIKSILAPDNPPFAMHMDIYGPCHQTTGHKGTTGSPYLAIHGDADNSVDPELCQSVYKDIEAAGSPVESHVIAGAGHAWENADPISEFGGAYIKDCSFSFDHETGAFTVNGKQGFNPAPDMTREQRAAVRAGLGELAGGCIGMGYTVGSNPDADYKSKAWQLAFMKRVFAL